MLNEKESLFLKGSLPFWEKITDGQRDILENAAVARTYQAGESLHNGPDDCVGLLLIESGRIRVFVISESGKEITLFHLLERDICLLSASCMMKNINFDVYVQAEKESRVILIPTPVYNELNNHSLPIADYTNQLMSSKFSDVMWIMQQVLFMSFDRRLALFLLEQAAIEGGNTLDITHETIAKHLGSAREVVTRMLKYFQTEGMVSLSRGGITITDRQKLQKLV